MSEDEITPRDKINILLEEYKTLRTEIMNRTGYGFQSGAAFVAVVTWLVSQGPGWKLSLTAVIFIFVIALIFFRTNHREIWHAADRMRGLEQEINSRAGEHLLVWERLYGAARTTYLRSLFSALTPLPRSALPALDTTLAPQKKEREDS